MIQKILDAITIEGAITSILYSIIATFIVRFFDYIFKSGPNENKASAKWDLINFGEAIGCFGAMAAIVGFILIYIFGTVDKIFTIEWLTKLFLICYGGFLLLHIIHSLLMAIKGQGNLVKSIEGTSLMILFPSIFIMLLFRFKMIAEIHSGLTMHEVDEANKGLIEYWIFLMKAVLVSGGFLIISKLLNLIMNRDKVKND